MDDEQRKFGVQSRRFSSGPLACGCLIYPPYFSGRLRERDAELSWYQHALSLTPRSVPIRALGVFGLAMMRYSRYMLSNQQDDLDQSILGFTEATLSLPLSLPFPNINHINQAFHFLTLAISLRAEKSSHPEDVKYTIIYLRYLRGLPHVPYPFSFPVTENLVYPLALQARLKLGDVDENVEEMADLCDELLDSDVSTDSLTRPIMLFASTVEFRDKESPYPGVKFPSEKVIGCLRRVIKRLPDPQVSIVLAGCLLRRFKITASDDDCNEGMAILDKVINFRGPGDTPSPYQAEALAPAVWFSYFRFLTSGKPEHLEQAIYLIRTLLDRLSLDDPRRDYFIEQHSRLQRFRFDGSGLAPESETSPYESGKLPSFRDLTASLPELSVKPLTIATLNKHRNALHHSTIGRLTDMADIEDGVNYCQQSIASYPDHPILAPVARRGLSWLFRRAFECTNEIEYLNRAISAGRDSANAANSRLDRFLSLTLLYLCLLTRLSLLKRKEDLNETIQTLRSAAENASDECDRFQLLCFWASVARVFGHSSVSTAYDRAMSSMQACLTLSPTLDIQHTQLVVRMGNSIKSLPFDCASHQIHTSQLTQAIVTLERGRSLLWSEMRGLRSSTDQIRSIDPHLADNFAAVSRELETLTLGISPSSNVDGTDSDVDGMDPFGHLVVQQRRLVDDREKLISQIQALPGFDTFLKPPSFETLRSAARHGPVIIINHSQWRSDIIIVLHNSPPSLITTSDDFYARAIKLQDELLGARRKGLESNKYEDTLRSVLEELYEIVGLPVIKRLNELNVPEQSRIWWCPTSVFCSLPLHAMGPIPSDMGHPLYFLDLYIPSYTSSLSALIESRKPGSQGIGKPSILLVAQPDEKMPEAMKEMKSVQVVDTQVTTLFSARATPTAVLARLPDHQFAHIVCHGMLEPGKPFESSFKLHKGKRLQLLDIVMSQLPNAEFAFLSACHTAELTEESISDEVLHLAAAMQFCGFRSVVGTMWAMADIDGRDLARRFYQSVFSNEGQEGRYYERTASALRDAVGSLRRKGGITLERWVNFVHYGA
jgi:CHAT domain-containing protein